MCRHNTRVAFLALLLLLVLAGCAQVHYEHNKTSLNDKELVFGKIILVRNGESGTISTTGTIVNIAPLESTAEPLLITEPLEKDGRFYWIIKPGQHLLSISLHEPTGDIVSLAFDVPDNPGAYYFGDLIMSGKKHFSALGAANVRDVKVSFANNFKAEKAELLRRNPNLSADRIGKLRVFDISKAHARAKYFRNALDASPICCEKMSAFHFEKLSPGKPISTEINRGQGTYEFSTGRSYFRAFELPDYSAPYSIHLHSQVMPTGIAYHFRVFAPAALLLDKKFNIVETIGPQGLRPMPASVLPPRAASLDEKILISGRNAQAKYLVLYTTDQLLGHVRLTSAPGMLLIPGGALPSGIPHPAGMMPWPTGIIEISLDTGNK